MTPEDLIIERFRDELREYLGLCPVPDRSLRTPNGRFTPQLSLILVEILDEPKSLAELSSTVGKRSSVVCRQLSRLMKAGLVERTGQRGYWKRKVA